MKEGHSVVEYAFAAFIVVLTVVVLFHYVK